MQCLDIKTGGSTGLKKTNDGLFENCNGSWGLIESGDLEIF